MKYFEYEFGVLVEANDEQEAWEKVRSISEQLDYVDAEEDSSVELVASFASKEDWPTNPERKS